MSIEQDLETLNINEFRDHIYEHFDNVKNINKNHENFDELFIEQLNNLFGLFASILNDLATLEEGLNMLDIICDCVIEYTGKLNHFLYSPLYFQFQRNEYLTLIFERIIKNKEEITLYDYINYMDERYRPEKYDNRKNCNIHRIIDDLMSSSDEYLHHFLKLMVMNNISLELFNNNNETIVNIIALGLKYQYTTCDSLHYLCENVSEEYIKHEIETEDGITNVMYYCFNNLAMMKFFLTYSVNLDKANYIEKIPYDTLLYMYRSGKFDLFFTRNKEEILNSLKENMHYANPTGMAFTNDYVSIKPKKTEDYEEKVRKLMEKY